MSDEKFYEKAKDFLLLTIQPRNILHLEEYNEKVKDQTDKDGTVVYLYTTDAETGLLYTSGA